jgi:hypothetical protein
MELPSPSLPWARLPNPTFDQALGPSSVLTGKTRPIVAPFEGQLCNQYRPIRLCDSDYCQRRLLTHGGR